MAELHQRTYSNKEKEITLFFKDAPDPEDGFAGYAAGGGLPHEVILCLDPRPNEKRNYDLAGIVKDNQLEKAVVFMEEAVYKGLKNNNPSAMFILFHEFGHYIFNPLQKEWSVLSEYMKDREELADAGNVIDEEITADEIATGYVGYDAAIKGLRWILGEQEKLAGTGLYDMESAERAMKEVRLRIRNLQQKRNKIMK